MRITPPKSLCIPYPYHPCRQPNSAWLLRHTYNSNPMRHPLEYSDLSIGALLSILVLVQRFQGESAIGRSGILGSPLVGMLRP